MIRGIAQGKKESLEYDLRGRALHAGEVTTWVLPGEDYWTALKSWYEGPLMLDG